MSGFTSLGKKLLGGAAGGASLNANATGPFGTSIVSNQTPAAQGAFIYGVNSVQWTTSSIGSGASVTVSEGVMTCSSGNSISGSAEIRLGRAVKYRAGQGSMARLTAVFGSGVTDTLQLAGIGNDECGYYFARQGTNFGILHRERSKREIRSFTITSPPAGAATVVVTLDGKSISVPINGGGSNNQTSYQLSQADYSQVGSGWTAESIDGIVYFTSKIPGPFDGSFTMTNGGSIATMATVQSGTLPTQTFISQSQWNVDTMDGNGPSRFTINPAQGNIYGVGFQYLGFGNPFFSIEDPETGLLTSCHMIKSANSRITTIVKNPQMTAKWQAINSGSSATSVSIKGASAGVFTEGIVTRNIGPAFATTVERTGIANDIDTNLVPVLTVRANTIFQGQSCYGEVDPFNLSVGSDTGSASSTILLKVLIYKNAGLTGPVNFQHVDSTRSIAAVDTAATGLTVTSRTQLIKTLVIAANQSEILKLADENFFLTSGETITIACQTNKNTSDVIATLSWFEDQ